MGVTTWDHKRRHSTRVEMLRSMRFTERWWACFSGAGSAIVSVAFVMTGPSTDSCVNTLSSVLCVMIGLSLLIGSILGFASAGEISHHIRDEEDFQACKEVLEE